MAAAETRIRSYGAWSGRPSTPGRAGRIDAHGWKVRARFAEPSSTSDGSSSTPSTEPVGPVRCASSAVDQPEPDPTSSTRHPGLHRQQPQHRLDGAGLGVGLAGPDVERPVVRRPEPLPPGQETPARVGRERSLDGVHALDSATAVTDVGGAWQGRAVPDRPDVPSAMVRRIGRILAGLPQVVEESAWVGTRWRVGQATVAHVFGGEDQLFRITFRAEPDEVMAFEHLGPPYFRAGWGRNVVGLLLDERHRLGGAGRAAHRLLLPPGAGPPRRHVDRPVTG